MSPDHSGEADGEGKSPKFKRHAIESAEALGRANLSAELHLVKGVSHSPAASVGVGPRPAGDRRGLGEAGGESPSRRKVHRAGLKRGRTLRARAHISRAGQ